MPKIDSKEVANLKVKLKLVREEIKNRSRNATENVKGLRRAEKQEKELLRRIANKENANE